MEVLARNLNKNKSESVRVAVRCRPLSKREKQDGREQIVDIDTKTSEILVKDESGSKRTYTFDKVFGEKSTQQQIYDEVAAEIVQSALDGFNGTIFAYGQTGTGKTYTMEGLLDDPGIMPLAFRHIFQNIAHKTLQMQQEEKSEPQQFLVRASYLEIYNDEVRDLLAKDVGAKMDVKEHIEKGFHVKNLVMEKVRNVTEIYNVLAKGKRNRKTGRTDMNEHSSRSHAIFTVTIESSIGKKIRVGKLNLVDLAGSERVSKTGTHLQADRTRFDEGVKINLSLAALGNVISALVENKSHVRYRACNLTKLLQDSLGGNTKTCMCATIGPADYNYIETRSTLNWANQAKKIKNKPRINEDPKDAMLRTFQEEIMRLKKQLEEKERSNNNNGNMNSNSNMARMRTSNNNNNNNNTRPNNASMAKFERKLKEAEMFYKEQRRVIEEEAETEVQRLKELQKIDTAEKKTMEKMYKEEQRKVEKANKANLLLKQEIAEKEKQLTYQLNAAEKHRVEKQYYERQAKLEEAIRDKETQKLIAENIKYEDKQFELKIKSEITEKNLDKKTEKLKRVWTKYQEEKSKNEEMNQQFSTERDDMINIINDLQHQLMLQKLIVENFIPDRSVKQIYKQAKFNERENLWEIGQIDYALNKKVYGKKIRQPQQSFIADVGLMDRPKRTTIDYKLSHNNSYKTNQRLHLDKMESLMRQSSEEIINTIVNRRYSEEDVDDEMFEVLNNTRIRSDEDDDDYYYEDDDDDLSSNDIEYEGNIDYRKLPNTTNLPNTANKRKSYNKSKKSSNNIKRDDDTYDHGSYLKRFEGYSSKTMEDIELERESQVVDKANEFPAPRGLSRNNEEYY